MGDRPPRVLIIAEHASRRFGGEAIIPYHLFRVMRGRGLDCWMVVHGRTRDELAALFGEDQIRYIPDLTLHRILDWCSGLLPGRVSYHTTGLLSRLLTQRLAVRLARRLIRDQGIDLVHQPIPVSPKEPSLVRRMGVPVVLGPLNGGMEFPPGFGSRDGRLAGLVVRVGRRLSNLVHTLLPAKREAALVLVANERTRTALPSGLRGRVAVLPENGVDVSLWAGESAPTASRPPAVRFAFVGRLVDWKGVDLLLEAFARLATDRPAELWIIGDGERRAALEQQARQLGVVERVRFTGWLTQQQCARQVAAADAFVLPSLYECGGAVVLEAMATGLPVIATRWGGPVDYLDETCGILVEPAGRARFVEGLCQAMQALAQDPERRARLGRAGRQRVLECFDWERKVDRLLEFYGQVLSEARGPQQ